MAPPPAKKRKTTGKTKGAPLKPVSAEFADHKEYRKSFKADKRYAKRHRALMFVESGPFNWTKLHFAVWRDDFRSVQKFVEFHQTTKPEVLLQGGQWKETALQLALRMERSPEMIKELLRGKGAEAINMFLAEYRFKDIDNEDLFYGVGFYPIHEAVNYKNNKNRMEVTKLLVENGADVNVQDYLPETTFFYATYNGHLDVVEYMLKNGAELREKDKFRIFDAIQKTKNEDDSINCLKHLFSLDKSDIHYKTPKENTLLHLACKGLKAKVAKFLIRAGVSIVAKNKAGKTALDLAEENDEAKDASKKLPLIRNMFKNTK